MERCKVSKMREHLWGRVSLVVTALFFNTIIPSDLDVMDAALDAGNWEFLATYIIVGGG